MSASKTKLGFVMYYILDNKHLENHLRAKAKIRRSGDQKHIGFYIKASPE